MILWHSWSVYILSNNESPSYLTFHFQRNIFSHQKVMINVSQLLFKHELIVTSTQKPCKQHDYINTFCSWWSTSGGISRGHIIIRQYLTYHTWHLHQGIGMKILVVVLMGADHQRRVCLIMIIYVAICIYDMIVHDAIPTI